MKLHPYPPRSLIRYDSPRTTKPTVQLILEVSGMAKRLTKTETKRLYAAILSKTKKLWSGNLGDIYMSTPDLVAIEKIIHKYQKRD